MKQAATTGGTAVTADTKLTFGPAWLRQLSSGDPKTALPPSPGLAFQLSKHRYSREEMLAIFETIEKSLANAAPSSLAVDFDELYRRDIQKPILLTAPSSEEQVYIYICFLHLCVFGSKLKLNQHILIA